MRIYSLFRSLGAFKLGLEWNGVLALGFGGLEVGFVLVVERAIWMGFDD